MLDEILTCPQLPITEYRVSSIEYRVSHGNSNQTLGNIRPETIDRVRSEPIRALRNWKQNISARGLVL